MNQNMRNEKLRGVFEELGFTNVRSVISSGNILFESPSTDTSKLESRLESAWPKKLEFTSTTIIRSLAELKALTAYEPFAGYEHGPQTYLNVTFLKHQPDSRPALAGKGFRIAATYDREVCSIIDTTTSKTPDFMAQAEKLYGKQITTRTWKTVGRIISALEA